MRIKQDQNIGLNIRDLRIQNGMTQEQVTAKMQLAGCDISRSIYSQIEAGAYNIRVSELAALRTIFNTDFNAFFKGIQQKRVIIISSRLSEIRFTRTIIRHTLILINVHYSDNSS